MTNDGKKSTQFEVFCGEESHGIYTTLDEARKYVTGVLHERNTLDEGIGTWNIHKVTREELGPFALNEWKVLLLDMCPVSAHRGNYWDEMEEFGLVTSTAGWNREREFRLTPFGAQILAMYKGLT